MKHENLVSNKLIDVKLSPETHVSSVSPPSEQKRRIVGCVWFIERAEEQCLWWKNGGVKIIGDGPIMP